VTRTITAAAIQAVPDQGVPADGTFAGVVRILESGSAYVNVHTTRFPGGEIPGQVKTDTDNSE
jgi:CHRD domain-containing protein